MFWNGQSNTTICKQMMNFAAGTKKVDGARDETIEARKRPPIVRSAIHENRSY
jgi:hypothetical protein